MEASTKNLNKTQRIFFLDNLKTFIIVLMVVFHAAMSYMAYGPEWWYVMNDDTAMSATLFVIWADVFIMPIMFFVSGYFGFMSLSKHDNYKFWSSKVKRIAVPWIFGAMVIAPYIAYLTFASRDIPMSFADFYITQFWGVFYQHGHFWYLGFLLMLYVLMYIICSIVPSFRQKTIISEPSNLFLAGVFIFISLAVFCLWQIFPDEIWLHPLYIICFQPTRAPIYIVYFFVGVMAWRHGWFKTGGYCPSIDKWLPLFIVVSIAYPLYRVVPPESLGISAEMYTVVKALLHSLLCMASIFALLAVFQRYGNHTSALLSSLAVTSYPIYWIHQIFVQNTIWLIRPWEVNLYVKYVIACVVSLVLSYLVSKYILMYLPCFKVKMKK